MEILLCFFAGWSWVAGILGSSSMAVYMYLGLTYFFVIGIFIKRSIFTGYF